MKLITFCVPCYNSEEYMEKCVRSLLTAGEDAEIVIVDDGSTDGTARIADRLAEEAPAIVKVIHKANGGHGSGVNAGLAVANGMYYKVVDSDDWMDADALKTFLSTLKAHIAEGKQADLYFTDFVYEKVCDNRRFVRSFRKNFPKKEFFGWSEVKKFHFSSVLVMHSLIYRTDVLRRSGVRLPEHTFYVDNIFASRPLPFARRLCYLPLPLYRYFIGREDQSVSRSNITKRYLQQIRVMKECACAYSYREIAAMDRGLKHYLRHFLGVLMTLTIMFTTASRTDVAARTEALDELWSFLRAHDKKMCRYLKHRTYPALVHWLPFRLQGVVTELGYRFFRAKIKCS